MSEAAYGARQLTLVDLVDRLLGKGATLTGDITLAVADIDLVQISLRALLASVATVGVAAATPVGDGRRSRSARGSVRRSPRAAQPSALAPAAPPLARTRLPARRPPTEESTRLVADPERAERALAQLVLTLVELLRQLMERQALRRVEDGTLDEEEIERLGTTFMRLEQRMEELKRVFDLRQEDLNLNLGPLGDLV